MSSATSRRQLFAAAEHERPAITRLARLLGTADDEAETGRPRIADAAGDEQELTETVVDILRLLAYHLSRGESITLVPVPTEVTIEQAADLLNVSESYLGELLAQGKLSSTGQEPQSRIRFDDLMAYKGRRDKQRRSGLRELTRLSQKYGLYGEARRAAGAIRWKNSSRSAKRVP